jgi:hypothetical protein
VSIILQNWDKCIFSAAFPSALENGRHSCVVRLEALGEQPPHFAVVAATQGIAATCIPDLIPETLRTGTAGNGHGREFEYGILELVEGVTLEEAWDHMSAEDWRSVTAAIIEAVSKLQSVRLGDAKVQAILRRALSEGSEEALDKAVMGGPLTGFLDDGPSFMSAIEQKWKLRVPFHTSQPISEPEGVVITSIFDDLGSVTVTTSNMEQWPTEAVFCHNDLTPRNVMVRATKLPTERRDTSLPPSSTGNSPVSIPRHIS